MKLTGQFQITDWQESVIVEYEDGAKLTTANVMQEYNGSLSGSAKVHYLMSYSKDGNALFTGFEVIEAQLDGEPSRIVLKHNGLFSAGIASSQFEILDSGTAQKLQGLTGNFNSSENCMANYTIG